MPAGFRNRRLRQIVAVRAAWQRNEVARAEAMLRMRANRPARTRRCMWQARQPVYKTSVGRWRHYAPYVPGLARFGQRH